MAHVLRQGLRVAAGTQGPVRNDSTCCGTE
ncbi:hypothetical protein ACUXKL_000867 [Kocuria marina]